MAETHEAWGKRIVGDIMSIERFWKAGMLVADGDHMADEESSTLVLVGSLVDGLAGKIGYGNRFEKAVAADRSMYDDALHLAVDTAKVDISLFAHSTFPRLIEAMQAYRAVLRTDETVWHHDFTTRVRQFRGRGPDREGRDTVERIGTVNFFDDTLCRRAFGIDAAEVVRRAAPVCERAEMLGDGAFLVVTTDVVTGRPALDALHERVMARITAG